MAILHVERIGGLAGFGGTRSHLRSRGRIDTASLSPADLKAVERLFQTPAKATGRSMPDAFHYRISRATADGTETVEAHEAMVPAALAQCVQDELV